MTRFVAEPEWMRRTSCETEMSRGQRILTLVTSMILVIGLSSLVWVVVTESSSSRRSTRRPGVETIRAIIQKVLGAVLTSTPTRLIVSKRAASDVWMP